MQKAFFSIIILLLLFQLSAFCQKQDVGHVCANDLVQYAPYPKNSATLRTKNFGAVGGINYVPIQLHVLRRNDGSTSFDWSRFLKSFENLNKIFAEIDVQFYLITSVNYINNTDFYDFNADFEENDMCNANDASNAVNLYLTNSIIFGYGFNATGYAYYPSPIAASNRIFLTNSAINTGTRTLVHEFGHYFNLLHTFQDNNNPQLTKRELVTRGFGANCSVAGDFVCDTPADPFGLTGATYNGCIYSGNTTDANGMLYSPDLTNTMSYYSESCGSDFSTGQFVRMQEGYTFRNSPENEYNLNFVDQGVTAPSNLVVSATSAGIAINFTDNATNELGYLIERATAAAGPFEPVGSVSANIVSYVDQSVLSNTIFYYRVRALNGIGYSNVGQAATGTFYCQPIYQQSCASFPVVMEQFSIAGTALRNINSGCSPNNYGKFTNMVAELEKGKSYTFTASATTTANVPYYAQYLTLWIDFNQDGFFESNEIVYKSTSSSGMNPSVSSLISIPNTAVDGFTMLRARTQYFSFGEVADPCKELVMGETEDYVVNITSPAANSLINIQFVSPLTVCRGNTVSLNFSTSGGGFSSSTRYVVQIDDRNGQFFNLPTQMTSTGTLLATIPLSFATGSGFSVRVVAENPQVTSPIAAEKLTIIAVPPSPTLTINQPSANVCIGSSVSINAVGCAGIVTWSDNFVGNPYTFLANKDVTLAANCTVNGCTGNFSTPISITTKSLPAPPQISSAKNVYCAGETVTLNAASCSGTVTWSNGSTGSLVSFTASSTLTLSATCRINGCESNASAPFALTVNSKPAPPQISSAKNVYCAGETVTLNATSCSGTVTWSNGSTGSSVSFTASSTLTLSATCLINGCESNASAPFALTVNSKPAPPLISIEDGSLNHCSGEKVTLNAANCFGTVNWNNGVAGSSVAVMVQTDTAYFATCTVNNCVSEKSADILFNCVPLESKVKRVTINLRVILEGPYNANAELMSTTYNDRGLLPGQEPTSQFGLPTPSGQPYNRIPWDYAGSESVIDYAGTVVDWVLVSLKSDERTVIYQTAALLHADARIEFIEEFPELDTTNAYFVQIDHRNHVGAMSSEKIPILDNRISHNFTTTNSYVKPNTPAFGQKRIGNKYVLFVGDIEKGSVSQHYDINFADITKLRSSIGLFERYIDADLNLDADINFNDLIMWRENSGRFSSVTL